MTEPEPLQQSDRTYVRFRKRKLSYFAGCDYFRLASHPQVTAALRAGLEHYGLNVAASRLTTGNHRVYAELEAELARFFAAESALVVSTGYLTNVVVAQALAGNFSHALIDENAHPALVDAARLLDCPVLQFRHRDSTAVATAVQRCGPGASLILLTDGLFSRDGSAAPLDEYVKALPRDAWLLVDDAHGAGVLGRSGRGTIEHAGIRRDRVIQTLTLSKAFGVYGGAIICRAVLRHRILDRSRAFVGSTPLPLPLACAAVKALKILRADASFRRRLTGNANYVETRLRGAGLDLPTTPGPILALAPHRPGQAGDIKRELLKAGIYPSYIHYPGGSGCGYFRFVISSEHTRGQLDRLVEAVARLPVHRVS